MNAGRVEVAGEYWMSCGVGDGGIQRAAGVPSSSRKLQREQDKHFSQSESTFIYILGCMN